MADETQNPNGPAGQGPARSASGVDPAAAHSALDAFNRAVPALKSIVDQIDSMTEKLEKVQRTATGVNKSFRDWGNEARLQMTYMDSMEESFKKLADYQHKMAREGLKVKDYKQAVDLLEEMEKHNKKITEEGIFSPKQAVVLQRNTEVLRRGIEKFRSESGKAFDPKQVHSFMTELMQVNRISLDMAKNMKGVRLTGLHRDISSAGAAIKHLFQIKGNTQKYRDFAKTATSIRLASRDHLEGRKASFAARRDAIHADAARQGIRPFIRKRVDGSYIHDDRNADAAYDHGVQAARGHGMGRFASAIVGRASRERALGHAHPSMLTKAGMGILARGEGSIGRGVASYGMGAIEGVAGGAAELAAPLAPILGALEVVKLLFDKNATMNAEVTGGLGKGGIFSGKSNAIDALRQTRGNLNGPVYSSLGIGYNKNLEIAKSMQEAGLSTGNLAETNIDRDKNGFMDNSFGKIQQNVYGYGRLAGLDSSQTVNETIKLVTQYKLSLESTHDFFTQLTKDARTAGITTTKYLDILDDVNSHYTRSNKLLEATVDTMRLLSVTGRNTAEDLKDAMETVTNGGQPRSLEQSAYVNQQILGDPGMSSLQSKRIDNARQSALDEVGKSLGQPLDMAEWGPKLKNDLQGAIGELTSRMIDKFGNDTTGLAAGNSTLKGLRQAYMNQKGFAFAQGQGPNQGGVSLAFQRALTGDDVISQSAQTMGAFKSTFKGSKFTIKDFLEGNPELTSDGRYQMLMKQLGNDPTKIENLRNTAIDATGARLSIAGKPLTDAEKKDKNNGARQLDEQTYDYLKKQNFKFGAGDKYDALANALKDQTKKAKIFGLLSSSEMALQDSFGNPLIEQELKSKDKGKDDREAQEKFKQLSAGTRTTADIFADAFTSLFNKLSTPLDFIAKLLADSMFFGHKDSAEDTLKKSDLDALIKNGSVSQSLNSYDSAISKKQAEIAAAPAGTDTTALQDQVNHLKDARNDLQSKTDALQDSTQRNFVSGDDATQALSEISQVDPTALQALHTVHQGSLSQKLNPTAKADAIHTAVSRFTGAADIVKASQNSADGTPGNTTINNYQVGNLIHNQDLQKALNAAPGEVARSPQVTR